jgi:Cu+-exporting ATPase
MHARGDAAGHQKHGHRYRHGGAGVAAPGMVREPGCGVIVDLHTALHRAEHAGRTE